MTQAASDSHTRLRSSLTGSSRKTDPEATEAGSAKVPLREQQAIRQANGIQDCREGKGK